MATNQQRTTAGLCQEGDALVAAGCALQAAACYTSAFKTHVGSTVAHMRNLDVSNFGRVVSALEGWLDGEEEDEQRSMDGLNKGLAAVFLSMLCPNNLSASLFKMESILQRADPSSEEIFARCSALLNSKGQPNPTGTRRLILELTRALARFLTEPENPTRALQLYLKAFQKQNCECVRLLRSRQAHHLPKILQAFSEQMQKCRDISGKGLSEQKTFDAVDYSPLQASEILEFLLALSPGDPNVQKWQGELSLSLGKFEEAAEAFSHALNLYGSQPSKTMNIDHGRPMLKPAENRASCLVGRAAANFSVGGRADEVCHDLGDAFAVHPATARLQFQRLFSGNGAAPATRVLLRQQAERGLSGYRETVLARPDLRSTEGLELLDPVLAQLRTLCHLEPDGGGRELRVRLADCLLLRGEVREALSISSQLASAAPPQQSYQNTVQVLCGYARLLSDDHQGAMQDFQAVIEHRAPHPSSCVRALCGRGLLRMMAGSHYLTALDYLTASGLQPQETAFTVRCLVPWNSRGLLCTVLLEQGRVMLEHVVAKCLGPSLPQEQEQAAPSAHGKDSLSSSKEGCPGGVHALAQLLMELQPGTDAAQILSADALYQLGRVEEAYRLLLAMEQHSAARSPVLARLALLQLHRGFLYDANQLLKKLIQCGDTSCLRSLLSVAAHKDRVLLEKHCYTASKRILTAHRDEGAIREAVAYLSIAIMASGGEATDSLLERAKCYALLGQRKTAIFDFSAILREHPEHVPALCGRALTYLTLNQQKECTQDILAALRVDPGAVTQDILSVKERGRKLMCEWLLQACRDSLCQAVAADRVPSDEHLQEASLVGAALLKIDGRDPRWHLLYVDTLLAKGDMQASDSYLRQVFGQEPREGGAHARWGVVEAWEQRWRSAAQRLAKVAERDTPTLDFLLLLICPSHRKRLAQAASQEASRMSQQGQWESALPLLSVAVHALPLDDQRHLQYLRQRAACLARLGLHERAVADLDKVIQGQASTDSSGSSSSSSNSTSTSTASNADTEDTEDGSGTRAGTGPGPGPGSGTVEHALWAEDLCRRGRSLLQLHHQERAALQDFSRALGLHSARTLECVEAWVGRGPLAAHFLHAALQCYAEQQLSEAWALTERGLKVDGGHAELRRLRARIKHEASNHCIVN
ncbi:uncharacterized protein ttc34 [Engraulis encrasicolus]|uniref:uncharacterized protein ttc34 n=1 Tax=Engraulis encrasicolus TaxID=184585 RepID=UPI002FD0F323